MTTYLITGGAGFIGTNFLYYMTSHYPMDKFICLDALTYAGRLSNIEKLINEGKIEFIHGNICDKNLVDGIFKKYSIDVLVNFAAESHVDRSISDPSVFLNTNILGVGVLLDACRQYGIKRFHQISTDEVYGDLPLNRKDLRFSEKSPICPSSPYSASKASADLFVMSYHRTYGLPVTISRCSNNYGPYQHEEKFIPTVIQKALKNERIPIYGNGSNVRDWIYVVDHCRAIDTILHNGIPGEIYNVGGDCEIDNISLARTILEFLGKSDSLLEYVSDRPGHDLRYAIDMSKLKDTFDFRLETSFYEGLRYTIESYFKCGEKK